MAESNVLELQERLHLGLSLQEKYLPNGVELRFRLNRASPQFCIMIEADLPVVVKIDAAILSVCYVQLLPAIANDLNQSKTIINVQELIQSDPISFPQKPKGKQLNTKIDSSLRKALAVNRMNSSFPDRWSFSYLNLLKYVTNILAEPKY